MGQIEIYREHLRQMCDWESFLLAESRLPGPRANLELSLIHICPACRRGATLR